MPCPSPSRLCTHVWVVLLLAVAGLVVLVGVLYTVHRLKPASFKLTAFATMWFSISRCACTGTTDDHAGQHRRWSKPRS